MENLPKSVPAKYRERIQHWDDERDIGNSIIVSLNKGFEFGIDSFECRHVEGFDNVKDAVAGIRNSKPCACADCLK